MLQAAREDPQQAAQLTWRRRLCMVRGASCGGAGCSRVGLSGVFMRACNCSSKQGHACMMCATACDQGAPSWKCPHTHRHWMPQRACWHCTHTRRPSSTATSRVPTWWVWGEQHCGQITTSQHVAWMVPQAVAACRVGGARAAGGTRRWAWAATAAVRRKLAGQCRTCCCTQPACTAAGLHAHPNSCPSLLLLHPQLVDSTWRVKVTDFNLSRVLEVEGSMQSTQSPINPRCAADGTECRNRGVR